MEQWEQDQNKIIGDLPAGFESTLLKAMSDALHDGNSCVNVCSTSDGMTATALKLDDIIKAKELLENRPPPVKVYFDKYMTETVQTKFPRKKKNRRWDKKYRKKYTCVKPMGHVYLDKRDQREHRVYCHPSAMDGLIKASNGALRGFDSIGSGFDHN